MSDAVSLVNWPIVGIAREDVAVHSPPNGMSGAVSVMERDPSKTILEVKGTKRLLVSHLMTGIDSPLKAPIYPASDTSSAKNEVSIRGSKDTCYEIDPYELAWKKP